MAYTLTATPPLVALGSLTDLVASGNNVPSGTPVTVSTTLTIATSTPLPLQDVEIRYFFERIGADPAGVPGMTPGEFNAATQYLEAVNISPAVGVFTATTLTSPNQLNVAPDAMPQGVYRMGCLIQTRDNVSSQPAHHNTGTVRLTAYIEGGILTIV